MLNLLIHDSGLHYICGNPINCATGPVLVTASQIGGGGGSENSEDRGAIGRQDKRPASFAAVCGWFSIRYAYGTPSRSQPLRIFLICFNALSCGRLTMTAFERDCFARRSDVLSVAGKGWGERAWGGRVHSGAS